MKVFSKKLWMATFVVSGLSNCMYAEKGPYDSQAIEYYDQETKQLIKTVYIFDTGNPGDAYIVRYDNKSGEFYYQFVFDNRNALEQKLQKSGNLTTAEKKQQKSKFLGQKRKRSNTPSVKKHGKPIEAGESAADE